MKGPFKPPYGAKALPINALRNSLVTRDPALTAAAVRDWQAYVAGAEPPLRLPLSVLHQAWKRMPKTTAIDQTQSPYAGPYTSAMSVAAALSHASGTFYRTGPGRYVPQGVPQQMGPHAMVRRMGANRFPAPGPLPSSQPSPPVRARPMRRPLAPPAQALAMHEAADRARRAKAYHDCQAARHQAEAARRMALSIVYR